MYGVRFRRQGNVIARKSLDVEEAYAYNYDCLKEPMPLLIDMYNQDIPTLIKKYFLSYESINKKLRELTHVISHEYLKVADLYMRGKIFLWRTDLEVIVDIYAHVDKLDPLYSDEEDAEIVKLTDSIHLSRSDMKIPSLIDSRLKKDSCTIKGFESLNHCYLFHALYDHTDLDLFNILRIDRFTFNIKLVTHSIF